MTGTVERELLDFADRHFGLFRLEDARRIGFTARQVQRRVRSGRIERLGTGVYRVVGAPATTRQTLLAASWRADGPVSQLSATWVHQLSRRAPPIPEVTVDHRSAHEFDGIRVFRSDDLEQRHLVTLGPLVVTSPARTLLDIGHRIGIERLEAMTHDAVHRRLTTFEELRRLHATLSERGRNGSAAMGGVLAALDPARSIAQESPLEVLVLRAIRAQGLPLPDPQHVVVVDHHEFRLDMSYPVVRLFIEGDGFGVHGMRSSFERDRWRQNLLVAHGWTPLRFTWRQVCQDRHAIGVVVERTLRRLGHPGLTP